MARSFLPLHICSNEEYRNAPEGSPAENFAPMLFIQCVASLLLANWILVSAARNVLDSPNKNNDEKAGRDENGDASLASQFATLDLGQEEETRAYLLDLLTKRETRDIAAPELFQQAPSRQAGSYDENCISHTATSRPLSLNWNTLFRLLMEPEYNEAWKYLPPSAVETAISVGRVPIETIVEPIATLPASIIDRRNLVELGVRIMYLESILLHCRLVAGTPYSTSIAKTLKQMVSSLRGLARTSGGHLVGRVRDILTWPPAGISGEQALYIYGSDPADESPADELTISRIDNGFYAWDALVRSDHANNQHLKLLLLMRHLQALPDKVASDQLSKIAGESETPLPFHFIHKLQARLRFPQYRLTLASLKDQLYVLAKSDASIDIEEHAVSSRTSKPFSHLLLGDMSIEAVRKAVRKLEWGQEQMKVQLPDPDSQSVNLFVTLARLSNPQILGSKHTKFVTLSGHELSAPTVNEWVLKYFEILFNPKGPRAFLLHKSGSYFPACGLNPIFLEALANLFLRSLLIGHIDIPYKISEQYFGPLLRPNDMPVAVKDVYGDFLEEGREIMADRKYSMSQAAYMHESSQVLSPKHFDGASRFFMRLLSGQLQDMSAGDSLNKDLVGEAAEKCLNRDSLVEIVGRDAPSETSVGKTAEDASRKGLMSDSGNVEEGRSSSGILKILQVDRANDSDKILHGDGGSNVDAIECGTAVAPIPGSASPPTVPHKE